MANILDNTTELQSILQMVNELPDALSEVQQAEIEMAFNTETGTITASAKQDEGYVKEGTKTTGFQLRTNNGGTYTPSTKPAPIVTMGEYMLGDVTIDGDSNLVPENIAEGVSIFGVKGSHSGGASVETVTLNIPSNSVIYYYATTCCDGVVSTEEVTISGQEVSISDVVKGSIFAVKPYSNEDNWFYNTAHLTYLHSIGNEFALEVEHLFVLFEVV